MSVDARDVALLVDRVAGSVPGVTRVFPASPSAARAARQALGSTVPLSVVHVAAAGGTDAGVASDEIAGDRMTVDVCVGIEGDPSSIGVEVSRAVRAAVGTGAPLPAPGAVAGAVPVVIRVRISRVR